MPHRAKKSLGQHFLTSEKMLQRIVLTARLTKDDTVLEIGPGKGALTECLLASGAHVVAVEKDKDLVPHLRERFAAEIEDGRLTLIEDDALAFDPVGHGLSEGGYKLVANIPYYITGEIIRRFLAETVRPSSMALLVQKEVAERIATKDGKESILSLSVKLYGEPRIALRVSKRYFSPIPKVDSAVIVVEGIHAPELSRAEERRFFELVKRGFSQKRKQVLSLLSTLVEKEAVLEAFRASGIRETARAEDLPLRMWLSLAKEL